jgi:hypothetical protein
LSSSNNTAISPCHQNKLKEIIRMIFVGKMPNNFAIVSFNRWTDSTVLDFTSWNGNEPNDAFGGERCGALISSNGEILMCPSYHL